MYSLCISRIRKHYLPVLEEKREERRRVKEECRVKEVEKEIEDRERKKAEEEEQKRSVVKLFFGSLENEVK